MIVEWKVRVSWLECTRCGKILPDKVPAEGECVVPVGKVEPLHTPRLRFEEKTNP